MARDINNLYNLFQYIIRKERGTFCTVEQFDQNLDAGQLDAIAEWFAPYGVDQKLHDALRPIRIYTPIFSDATGYVSFPTNYLHLLGNPFVVNGSSFYELDFVSEAEFVFAMNSQQRPVTATNPIAFDTSTGFKMWPEQMYQLALNYIRRPSTPVLFYTQVGRTITYNSAGSTQLQFSEIYWNNILAKALKYAGINMNEDGVYKFAEQYDKETQ